MQNGDYASLEMLVTVSRLLSSKLELGDLLNYTMKLASRVVGAERASLFLIDNATGELYFDVAMGLDPELQKIRLKPGQGIAGRTVQEEKSIIINDVGADGSHLRAIDEKSGFVTKSILSCPMIVKGKVIGVVQALNRLEGPFTEHDLHNFEAFASQAAVAIENARLFSALREEKRMLGLFFERTSEAVVILDAERRVKLTNDAATRYLPEAAAGLEQALSAMTVTPSLNELLASATPVADFECEREQPKKLYLQGSVIPLFTHGTQGAPPARDGWIFLFRDVTAKKTEERLSRDFLSLVSHKLRTPLTIINGYLELLGEQVTDPEAVKAMSVITRQGRKLNALVDDVVSFTAVEGLDPARLARKTVDLGGVADAAARNAAEQHEAELTAHTAGAPVPVKPGKVIVTSFARGVTVPGDESLLVRAVAELITNALKFNAGAAKTAAVTVGQTDGCAVVSVADNGPGIPPEELGNIFQKFYQAETSFTGQVEGWGLGLAFVKRVTEAHGGQVEVNTAPGSGSEFRLKLPLAARPQ